MHELTLLCICVSNHIHLLEYIAYGYRISAPVYSLNVMMLARSEQVERCQVVDAGRWRREERSHQPTGDR